MYMAPMSVLTAAPVNVWRSLGRDDTAGLEEDSLGAALDHVGRWAMWVAIRQLVVETPLERFEFLAFRKYHVGRRTRRAALYR